MMALRTLALGRRLKIAAPWETAAPPFPLTAQFAGRRLEREWITEARAASEQWLHWITEPQRQGHRLFQGSGGEDVEEVELDSRRLHEEQ